MIQAALDFGKLCTLLYMQTMWIVQTTTLMKKWRDITDNVMSYGGDVMQCPSSKPSTYNQLQKHMRMAG